MWMNDYLTRLGLISITPPLFIKVPVASRDSERSCICVRGIDFTSFYDFEIWLELFQQGGIFVLHLFMPNMTPHGKLLETTYRPLTFVLQILKQLISVIL